MILNWCAEPPRKDPPPPGEPPGERSEADRTSAEIIIFPGLHLHRLQALRELRRKMGKPFKGARVWDDEGCPPGRDEECPPGRDEPT